MSGPPCAVPVADITLALRSVRFHHQNEAELQLAFASLLDGLGLAYTRELALSHQDRIDFRLKDCGLGIELKVKGSVDAVAVQLSRYAAHDEIAALLLFTTRAQHLGLPSTIGGKHLWVRRGNLT